MEYQNNTVAILLATYNGSRFIDEQLSSIINQSFTNWIVYISDDGSTDNTVDIINKYIEEYPSKFILCNSETKHRGAAINFLLLLKNVSAKYYMFCDQDDVWLPNKIEDSLSVLRRLEILSPATPILVHTDLMVVNAELNIISTSMWDYIDIRKCIGKFEYYKLYNVATGCTMLFNHSVKSILPDIADNQDILMHDYYILLHILKNNGVIHAVPTSTVLYRQHGNNTLGAIRYNKSIYNYIKNIRVIVKNNYKSFVFVKSICDLSLYDYVKLKFRKLLDLR